MRGQASGAACTHAHTRVKSRAACGARPYIVGTCPACGARFDSRVRHECTPLLTPEQRISALESAVQRIEARAMSTVPAHAAPSPAETLIHERGGFVAYQCACDRPITNAGEQRAHVAAGHGAPPAVASLDESRTFIERAAKLSEAAGAVDIAGALMLLAEVVRTRAESEESPCDCGSTPPVASEGERSAYRVRTACSKCLPRLLGVSR